ncbi:hypothetical protein D3C78_1175340 [compost metagenome]
MIHPTRCTIKNGCTIWGVRKLEDRLLFSLMILPFVIWGVLSIKFPVFMFKTSATNNTKKTPTLKDIRKSKISGCVMLTIAIILLIINFTGGFGF